MYERLSDAAVVDVITARARTSAAADAEKYAAIAELERRRSRDGEDREKDAADPLDGAAAEIGAALNIGHGRALGEIDIATMLRDKFPRLNSLFLEGLLNSRRAWIIEKRTYLVVDPAAHAALDEALANRILGWGPVSEWKLEQLVDAEVERIDPAAVRKVRESVRDRDFVIGRDTKSGTVAYWGRMRTDDAAIANGNVAVMVHSVCPDDPRTLKQRRGDAHAALMAGSTVLKCLCDNPSCPAASVRDAAAGSVVIHVITDQATLDAAAVDPEMHGPRTVEGELDEILDDESPDDDMPDNDMPDDAEELTADAAAPPVPWRPLAIIPGYGVVPPTLLAELVARGAKVKPIDVPTGDAEPRYRPSAVTDHFVRLRDLTCRAPGCDRLAEFTDIDHTVPYPEGATHAGGLKCYCRKHHLIKTFHAGWSDAQLADGTVVITTPTGHSYTTRPGIELLFPNWNVTTTAPPGGPVSRRGSQRSLMMPRRKRTRTQATADRIRAERAENLRDEPPPF